jgi:hypothetical protein
LSGSQPGMDDKEAMQGVKEEYLDGDRFPNVTGWYNLVKLFSQSLQDSWERV